jgi:hypothetical protein
VTFAFGRARVRATTDHSTGIATATFPVQLAPGDFPLPKVTVAFDEAPGFLGSSDSREVVIAKAPTSLVATSASIPYGNAADIATLFAQLPSGNQPLREMGVHLALSDGRILDTLTDGFGRVLFDTLDFASVQPGTYPLTLSFAGNDRYLPSTLSLTQTVSPDGNHSASFNGANGYAEAPSSANLNITGNWTVETWFKDEDPKGFNHDTRQIIVKGPDGGPEAPYFLSVGHNAIQAGFRAAGRDYTIATDLSHVDPTVWHHVAVTLRTQRGEEDDREDESSKGIVISLWLDGRLIKDQGVPARTRIGNSLPVEIGRSGPTTGNYWQGKIDDLRIWNIARSGADITKTYRTELTTNPTGLVANWRFNEPLLTLFAYSSVGTHTAILSTSGAAFSTDIHK